MKRIWLLAAAAGLAVLLVGGGIVLAQSADDGKTTTAPGTVNVSIPNQQVGIWVNGLGKVSVTPDLATLSLGVEAQASNVTSAQEQASEAMNKVIAVLKANGVAEKDIKTQYFNINKITQWDEKGRTETIIGYRVTNTVVVKIRDLAKVGTIIDDVAVAGGDLTRINGIDFSLEDTTAAAKQARDLAMADAKNKAEQLADLGEVTLGKPTYISENSYFPYPVRYAGEAMDAISPSSTPIVAGEMEITVNVQVTYDMAE